MTAERVFPIDRENSALTCRRAMECAVKWMYSVNASLYLPYSDSLHSLMDNEEFRALVGPDIWKRMELIRKAGNGVAHTGKKLKPAAAALCLEKLFVFLDYVAFCYSDKLGS
ncbi:MAG: DUF4145 domain-containing protein [Candidatus Onthomonas sp.]